MCLNGYRDYFTSSIYMETKLKIEFILYPSFLKMDVRLEFDLWEKWGVDGINLLINIVILYIYRDYFQIILLLIWSPQL